MTLDVLVRGENSSLDRPATTTFVLSGLTERPEMTPPASSHKELTLSGDMTDCFQLLSSSKRSRLSSPVVAVMGGAPFSLSDALPPFLTEEQLGFPEEEQLDEDPCEAGTPLRWPLLFLSALAVLSTGQRLARMAAAEWYATASTEDKSRTMCATTTGPPRLLESLSQRRVSSPRICT